MSHQQKEPFYCGTCKLPYDTSAQYEEHLWSMLHHRVLENNGQKEPHFCTLCKEISPTLSEYSVHLISEKHKDAHSRWQQVQSSQISGLMNKQSVRSYWDQDAGTSGPGKSSSYIQGSVYSFYSYKNHYQKKPYYRKKAYHARAPSRDAPRFHYEASLHGEAWRGNNSQNVDYFWDNGSSRSGHEPEFTGYEWSRKPQTHGKQKGCRLNRPKNDHYRHSGKLKHNAMNREKFKKPESSVMDGRHQNTGRYFFDPEGDRLHTLPGMSVECFSEDVTFVHMESHHGVLSFSSDMQTTGNLGSHNKHVERSGNKIVDDHSDYAEQELENRRSRPLNDESSQHQESTESRETIWNDKRHVSRQESAMGHESLVVHVDVSKNGSECSSHSRQNNSINMESATVREVPPSVTASVESSSGDLSGSQKLTDKPLAKNGFEGSSDRGSDKRLDVNSTSDGKIKAEMPKIGNKDIANEPDFGITKNTGSSVEGQICDNAASKSQTLEERGLKEQSHGDVSVDERSIHSGKLDLPSGTRDNENVHVNLQNETRNSLQNLKQNSDGIVKSMSDSAEIDSKECGKKLSCGTQPSNPRYDLLVSSVTKSNTRDGEQSFETKVSNCSDVMSSTSLTKSVASLNNEDKKLHQKQTSGELTTQNSVMRPACRLTSSDMIHSSSVSSGTVSPGTNSISSESPGAGTPHNSQMNTSSPSDLACISSTPNDKGPTTSGSVSSVPPNLTSRAGITQNSQESTTTSVLSGTLSLSIATSDIFSSASRAIASEPPDTTQGPAPNCETSISSPADTVSLSAPSGRSPLPSAQKDMFQPAPSVVSSVSPDKTLAMAPYHETSISSPADTVSLSAPSGRSPLPSTQKDMFPPAAPSVVSPTPPDKTLAMAPSCETSISSPADTVSLSAPTGRSPLPSAQKDVIPPAPSVVSSAQPDTTPAMAPNCKITSKPLADTVPLSVPLGASPVPRAPKDKFSPASKVILSGLRDKTPGAAMTPNCEVSSVSHADALPSSAPSGTSSSNVVKKVSPTASKAISSVLPNKMPEASKTQDGQMNTLGLSGPSLAEPSSSSLNEVPTASRTIPPVSSSKTSSSETSSSQIKLPDLIQKLLKKQSSKPNLNSARPSHHRESTGVATGDLKRVLLGLFDNTVPQHYRKLQEEQLKKLFAKAGNSSDRFKKFGVHLEMADAEEDEMIKVLEKLTAEDLELLAQNESQDILHELLSLYDAPSEKSSNQFLQAVNASSVVSCSVTPSSLSSSPITSSCVTCLSKTSSSLAPSTEQTSSGKPEEAGHVEQMEELLVSSESEDDDIEVPPQSAEKDQGVFGQVFQLSCEENQLRLLLKSTRKDLRLLEGKIQELTEKAKELKAKKVETKKRIKSVRKNRLKLTTGHVKQSASGVSQPSSEKDSTPNPSSQKTPPLPLPLQGPKSKGAMSATSSKEPCHPNTQAGEPVPHLPVIKPGSQHSLSATSSDQPFPHQHVGVSSLAPVPSTSSLPTSGLNTFEQRPLPGVGPVYGAGHMGIPPEAMGISIQRISEEEVMKLVQMQGVPPSIPPRETQTGKQRSDTLQQIVADRSNAYLPGERHQGGIINTQNRPLVPDMSLQPFGLYSHGNPYHMSQIVPPVLQEGLRQPQLSNIHQQQKQLTSNRQQQQFTGIQQQQQVAVNGQQQLFTGSLQQQEQFARNQQQELAGTQQQQQLASRIQQQPFTASFQEQQPQSRNRKQQLPSTQQHQPLSSAHQQQNQLTKNQQQQLMSTQQQHHQQLTSKKQKQKQCVNKEQKQQQQQRQQHALNQSVSDSTNPDQFDKAQVTSLGEIRKRSNENSIAVRQPVSEASSFPPYPVGIIKVTPEQQSSSNTPVEKRQSGSTQTEAVSGDNLQQAQGKNLMSVTIKKEPEDENLMSVTIKKEPEDDNFISDQNRKSDKRKSPCHSDTQKSVPCSGEPVGPSKNANRQEVANSGHTLRPRKRIRTVDTARLTKSNEDCQPASATRLPTLASSNTSESIPQLRNVSVRCKDIALKDSKSRQKESDENSLPSGSKSSPSSVTSKKSSLTSSSKKDKARKERTPEAEGDTSHNRQNLKELKRKIRSGKKKKTKRREFLKKMKEYRELGLAQRFMEIAEKQTGAGKEERKELKAEVERLKQERNDHIRALRTQTLRNFGKTKTTERMADKNSSVVASSQSDESPYLDALLVNCKDVNGEPKKLNQKQKSRQLKKAKRLAQFRSVGIPEEILDIFRKGKQATRDEKKHMNREIQKFHKELGSLKRNKKRKNLEGNTSQKETEENGLDEERQREPTGALDSRDPSSSSVVTRRKVQASSGSLTNTVNEKTQEKTTGECSPRLRWKRVVELGSLQEKAVLGLHGCFDKLYAYSVDGTTRCHSLPELKQHAVYSGHQKPVTGLHVFTDTNRNLNMLFTSSEDEKLLCFNLENQQLLHTNTFMHPITCMVGMGESLFLGFTNGRVEVFHTQKLLSYESFVCHNKEITCLATAYIRGSRFFLSGASDGSLAIHSVSTGTLYGALNGHQSSVLCVQVSGNYVLSGGSNGRLFQHNILKKQAIKGYFCHQAAVTNILVQGSVFYTACMDDKVRVFNLCKMHILKTIRIDKVLSLGLYKQQIYVGKSDGSVILLPSASNKSSKNSSKRSPSR